MTILGASLRFPMRVLEMLGAWPAREAAAVRETDRSHGLKIAIAVAQFLVDEVVRAGACIEASRDAGDMGMEESLRRWLRRIRHLDDPPFKSGTTDHLLSSEDDPLTGTLRALRAIRPELAATPAKWLRTVED